MADYTGAQDDRFVSDLYLMPPGRSTGKHVPPAGTLDLVDVGTGFLQAIDPQAVAPGGPAAGTDDYVGAQDDRFTFAYDWFETAHLLPRDGVDFGNIVSQEDGRFEIFNSFRHEDLTLLSITNNATPGVELPDMPTPPDDLGPLQSYVDPGDSSLGQIVRALATGLPSFDTTIDFQIGSGVGTLQLRVQGNRIALLVADFDGEVIELLQFKTDILEKKDGSEQRISVRKNPRQIFEAMLKLDGNQRQMIQALLYGWQGMTIALPVRTEEMKLTAAITGGVTDTANVDTTDYVDLRVGGLAVIQKDNTTYDVLEVQSLTSTSITFTQTIPSTFATGDRVAPVRLTSIQGSVQGSRPPVNLEKMRIKFLVMENTTGAPTGDTSAYSTYNGKVLLDDYNFLNGEMTQSFIQKIVETDSVTGLVSQAPQWDKHKRSHIKGFVSRNRQSLWNVRRLLYALGGRWKSFYIPTFINDLTVTQTLASGDNKMTVSWLGYTRFIESEDQKSIFKITFTDDTSLVRVVQSSEQLSATEERLTLDANWPASRTVDEVRRVQFYELVRADSDEIAIRHKLGGGNARVFFPVKVCNG